MFQGVSEPSIDFKAVAKIAGAMLQKDWRYVVLIYPLIVFAPILSSTLELEGSLLPLTIALLERLGQLGFIYLISKRWISTLSIKLPGLKNILNFLSVGMAIWFLFAFPLTLQILNIPPTLKLITLPLLGIALWLSLTYFFYPIPILLSSTIRDGLKHARSITTDDKWIAAKILVLPTGVVSFLMALTYLPWPDGRSHSLLMLGEFLSGTFTLLACYLSLAIFFCKAPNVTRQSLGIERYLDERLATLQAQDFLNLNSILNSKRGTQLLFFSLAIWGINIARLMELPPSASIKIESITISGNAVTIEASANDQEFNFRGFHPYYLALAGEQRSVISEQPQKVEYFKDGVFQPVGFMLPRNNRAKLRLTYEANRKGQELKVLEDLHLWYRAVRLEKLNMAEAKLIADSNVQAPDAQNTIATPKATPGQPL